MHAKDLKPGDSLEFLSINASVYRHSSFAGGTIVTNNGAFYDYDKINERIEQWQAAEAKKD